MRFMKWYTIILAVWAVFAYLTTGNPAAQLFLIVVGWGLYGLIRVMLAMQRAEQEQVEAVIAAAEMTMAEAATYRKLHDIEKTNEAIVFGQWGKR